MTRLPTPCDAVSALLHDPELPAGDDERFVGFGVMGLPFVTGHYLALRDMPATSFSPAYRSVWHRDPQQVWTFYATTPGQLSCARYFSSVTANDSVQCSIDVSWVTPWSLRIEIAGLLQWHVDLRATRSSRVMTVLGGKLPGRALTNRLVLGAIGVAAGPILGAGRLRLTGHVPNGQRFMIAPTQVWAVANSRAVLRGQDLGAVGPLAHQARLADFRPPQRGLFAVGSGHFDAFDARHHRSAERTVAIT